MKRCTVCREKVYRNFQEHVLMHVRAVRRMHSVAPAYASGVSVSELGVGTEIRPLGVPGFMSRIWQSICRFFNGLGS